MASENSTLFTVSVEKQSPDEQAYQVLRRMFINSQNMWDDERLIVSLVDYGDQLMGAQQSREGLKMKISGDGDV